MDKTFSKEDSWGLITLVYSTVLSHYLQGGHSVKLTERHGWHFTASTCKEYHIAWPVIGHAQLP